MLSRRRRAYFSVEQLPFDDDSAGALSDAERSALAEHWLRRGRSEGRIGLAFGEMLAPLRSAGAHEAVLGLLQVASDDERRHAEICLRIAEHYAGRGLEPAPLGETRLPSFGCADERLEAALLIAGTCCINETLATVWLKLCVAAASTPLARAAHRAHLRDEVDHARLGWAHVASDALDDELRAALGECVPRLLAANLPLWLTPDPLLPAAGIDGHGVQPQLAIEGAIQRAIDDILLPGFAHVGVRVCAPVAGRLEGEPVERATPLV